MATNDIVRAPTQEPLTVNEDGSLEVPVRYSIRADDKVAAYYALVAYGVREGSVYTTHDGRVFDPDLTARGISIAPENREIVGSLGLWIATVRYAKDSPTGSGGGGSGNRRIVPNGPAHLAIQTSLREVKTDVDRDGVVIANTAGVPYTNVQKLTGDEVLVATWVESGLTFARAVQRDRFFRRTLNAKPFLGAKPLTLFCRGLNPEAVNADVFEKGSGLIKFQARFQFEDLDVIRGTKVSAWHENRFSAGKRVKNADYDEDDPASEPFKPIMDGDADDKDRHAVAEDVLLNADGTARLASDGDPVLQTFKLYSETDFNTIYEGLG